MRILKIVKKSKNLLTENTDNMMSYHEFLDQNKNSFVDINGNFDEDKAISAYNKYIKNFKQIKYKGIQKIKNNEKIENIPNPIDYSTIHDNEDKKIQAYIEDLDRKIAKHNKTIDSLKRTLSNERKYIKSNPNNAIYKEQYAKHRADLKSLEAIVAAFENDKNAPRKELSMAAEAWLNDKAKEDWKNRDIKRVQDEKKLREKNYKLNKHYSAVEKNIITADDFELPKIGEIHDISKDMLSWWADFQNLKVDRNEMLQRRNIFRLIRLMANNYGNKIKVNSESNPNPHRNAMYVDEFKRMSSLLRKTLEDIKDKGYDSIDYPEGVSFDEQVDEKINYKATTPFLFAASLGLVEAMEMILEIFPNTYLNAQDRQSGLSALFYAIHYYQQSYDKNRPEMLDLLLGITDKNGIHNFIDPNLQNNNGYTAPMFALLESKYKNKHINAFKKIVETCGEAINTDITVGRKKSELLDGTNVKDNSFDMIDIVNYYTNKGYYSSTEQKELIRLIESIKDNDTGYQSAEIENFSNPFLNIDIKTKQNMFKNVFDILFDRIPIFNEIIKLQNLSKNNDETVKASRNIYDKWYMNWSKYFGINKSNITSISRRDLINTIKNISTYNIDTLNSIFDKKAIPAAYKEIDKLKNMLNDVSKEEAVKIKNKINYIERTVSLVGNILKSTSKKAQDFNEKYNIETVSNDKPFDFDRPSSFKPLIRQFNNKDIDLIASHIIKNFYDNKQI